MNASTAARKELRAFLEEHGECVENDYNESSIVYKLPPEKVNSSKKLKKKVERLETSTLLLQRNLVVSFVSEYDSFLGKLVKGIFSAKPELLRDCDRQLSFTDLCRFESIDDAQEFILEKEIETLLRSSHHQQFKWLESKFSVTLTKGLDSWGTFVELTQRRNLFVHCDGVVSEQYLKVCKEHNVDVKDLNVGDKLEPNRPYLTAAYICFYEIGVKLAQVFNRKIFQKECEFADQKLIEITYELLENEQHATALKLLDFGVNVIKNHANDANRRMLCINKAIAHKIAGDETLCTLTIDAMDWSACGSPFDLAVAALNGDDDRVYSLMKQAGSTDSRLSKMSYMEWPLFKWHREKSEFMKLVGDIFGNDVDNEEVLPTNN